MAPSPVSVACIEKRRLLQACAKAVSDYNRMNSAQLAAVMNGEDFPFTEEIAAAAAHRENAKYAIMTHQLEHGC